MKAAVVRAPGELRIEDGIDLAPPRSGEVRVRLVATGICHTDLTVLEGRFPLPMPVVIGHEGAGVVEKVGAGVTDLSAGDHVILSIVVSCRNCFQCRSGSPSLCEVVRPLARSGLLPDGTTRLSKAGEQIHHMFCQSSLAEWAVVPISAVIKVNPDVPLETIAGLGCGVLTGIGAVVGRARVRVGETVMIVGVGGVGLAAVMAARALNAKRIIAVDVSAAALSAAAELGATDLVDGHSGTLEQLESSVGGCGVDHALDMVGTPETIATCIQAVRPGGQVVAVGLSEAKATAEVPIYALLEEKRLTGTRAGSMDPHLVIPWCVDLYAAGRLPLDRLVTERYGLDELPQAFADLGSGRAGRGVVMHG